MTILQYILLLLCCLLPFCVIASAQESESAATSTQYARSETEAAELGLNNKVFMKSLTEYRELTKKLTALKVEYQDALPNRRAEIDAVYSGLYKQGIEHVKKLVLLALDAHAETPNRNHWVNELLYSMVQYEFSRENYEECVRIFKRMAASEIISAAKRSYVFAGLSAMLSMNYEDAEEWLKTSSESGELEKTFTSLAQSESGSEQAQTLQSQLQIMSMVKSNWEKEQVLRKAEAEAGEQDPAKKLPRVELTTTKGKVVLELFENEAPNTTANFVSLVEKGFYNNVVFHRVLPNFMAQGGDPTGSGRGGPGYTFDCETGNKFPQARKHFRGSISMANAGPNTNGSQFFLTFVPTVFLDGKHTVFGRVTEGIDILADIQRVDPDDDEAMIPELDKIIEAKVLNKRDHTYEVRKNGNR